MMGRISEKINGSDKSKDTAAHNNISHLHSASGCTHHSASVWQTALANIAVSLLISSTSFLSLPLLLLFH